MTFAGADLAIEFLIDEDIELGNYLNNSRKIVSKSLLAILFNGAICFPEQDNPFYIFHIYSRNAFSNVESLGTFLTDFLS